MALSNSMNSVRARMATILPDFPNLKEMKLPDNLDRVKTATFLMMYRTHCQRILDTIIRANFDEIQTFVLYFWQGVPPHLISILSTSSFINIICICDAILYKCVSDVLLPSALQTFPESLVKVIRKFSTQYECWLKMSLYNLPDNLRHCKVQLARKFGCLLRRQTSISQLSQAMRMVINNNGITSQMLNDWKLIDNQIMASEADIASDQHSAQSHIVYNIIRNAHVDFARLLNEESILENYLDWLNSLVHRCVINVSIEKSAKKNEISMQGYARQFLILWSSFGSRVICEMTKNGATSFGSFHLMRLMFDEYLLYVIEFCHFDEQISYMLSAIAKDEPPNFNELFFDGSVFICDPHMNQLISHNPQIVVDGDYSQIIEGHINNSLYRVRDAREMALDEEIIPVSEMYSNAYYQNDFHSSSRLQLTQGMSNEQESRDFQVQCQVNYEYHEQRVIVDRHFHHHHHQTSASCQPTSAALIEPSMPPETHATNDYVDSIQLVNICPQLTTNNSTVAPMCQSDSSNQAIQYSMSEPIADCHVIYATNPYMKTEAYSDEDYGQMGVGHV